MTVGPANGEPDDPYGYLYRPGPGDEPPVPGSTPGRVMPQYMQVGQTQPGVLAYGAQPQAAPPGIPPQPVPQQPAPQDAPPPGGRRAGGGGGGSRGPLFAVLGVVLVAAIVVAVVLSMGGDEGDKNADGATTAPPQASSAPPSSEEPSASPSGPQQFGQVEAENAQPNGVSAAAAPRTGSGQVLTGWQKGSSVTWSVEAPAGGQYKLTLKYGNAGPASDGGNRAFVPLTVSIDGKAKSDPVKLYGLGQPDAIGGTWGLVQLKKGANTITITCTNDTGCPIVLDRMYLEKA